MHGLEMETHAFGRLIGVAGDDGLIDGVMLMKTFMANWRELR